MRNTSHGAWAQMFDCKRNWLWVRSPLREIKYLCKFIFSFLRSDVEAKLALYVAWNYKWKRKPNFNFEDYRSR